MEEFYLDSCGAGRLHCALWKPEGEPKAVVQLIHGIAEHIGRYDAFAKFLTQHGYVVAADDHMGHGGSAENGLRGYFSGGWLSAVEDEKHLHDEISAQYPDLPYYILGHSMGSFYARQYLCEWGDELDGAIIMGTGYQPKALVQFARSTCRALAAVHGWQYRSKFVANMSFMGYNKGLEGRTTHDWLNRDQAEVDKYLADERCTFTFTLNAYYSMFSGILRLYDPALLARVPKDLPLLFLAGDADPVGEQGAGVKRAVKSLLDAGVKNIEVKLYPSARHELLVELNREEVFADIGDWLDRRL